MLFVSEEYIVRHAAPTLAGLKTGSVFSCPFESREDLKAELRRLNTRLCRKGLRVLPLRITHNRALLYLYRPQRLKSDLRHACAEDILLQSGYRPECCEECVARLGKKLRSSGEFPHEIGLFLGYPPEDVRGFMENNACNCKCVGCWKVYGDEAAAQKTFRLYKKCTRVYCDRWQKGSSLEKLTVDTHS